MVGKPEDRFSHNEAQMMADSLRYYMRFLADTLFFKTKFIHSLGIVKSLSTYVLNTYQYCTGCYKKAIQGRALVLFIQQLCYKFLC